MNAQQTQNQIAQTILQQLGGNRFMVMTGSKNFVASSNALSFSLARNASKANRCVITLDEGSDTYVVEFWNVNMKKVTMTTLKKYEGVYFDMLQSIFSDFTGLATSL